MPKQIRAIWHQFVSIFIYVFILLFYSFNIVHIGCDLYRTFLASILLLQIRRIIIDPLLEIIVATLFLLFFGVFFLARVNILAWKVIFIIWIVDLLFVKLEIIDSHLQISVKLFFYVLGFCLPSLQADFLNDFILI